MNINNYRNDISSGNESITSSRIKNSSTNPYSIINSSMRAG